MNVITKLMYSIHRILGTLLCILFLMWFLSAFVMMYHRFPRVSAKEKMQKLDMLSQTGDSLPDISSVTARLPRGVKVRSTILNLNAGHPEFSFSTTKGTLHFLADSTISRPSLDSEHLHRTAALWCSSPITRIDTLHSLDQWIPFAELKKEMPIYKIYFADDAGTQLYLSSQNGEALQFSNRSERFWAWLGAIPHWVYFTWLRQDTVLWTKTVIWLTALGCLMVIAGIWVTVDVWDYMLKAGGLTNFHVGTIEGYPTFDTMLAQLKAGKAKRVTLIPFMFVAGDHAKNDIAGEWKEMLEKEGFTVSAQLEGLGQIPEIQEIFIDHIRFGLKHRMLDIMTKKAAYAAGKDTE